MYQPYTCSVAMYLSIPANVIIILYMLQGSSHFRVRILHPHKRTTAGAILCHIFLAEDKSLAFKFNQDSREVMIDKFNASSKNSFQFELTLAGEFPKVNFAETC